MNEKVPKKMQDRFEEITSISDKACQEYLNDEYLEMSRKLAATLARKRPSPLVKGRANSWACGIVYAIGFVNFLFDKSFPPYLSAEELCVVFGVSKATGYNKSKEIRDLLNLVQFDPRWTLPSLMDENPLAWTISVDHFIVDARHAPRYIQEEAYRKGLIPYLPGGDNTSASQPNDSSLPFQVGDSVVVKPGVKDPDFGDDLGGWQGRIVEIDARPPGSPLATILWDSVTLKDIPRPSIERAEKEGLDWTSMGLYITELEKAASRDTLEDLEATLNEIASHVAWLHLGEEGERIQQILDGIDPDDMDTCFETWLDHLEITLVFPFEAVLVESESFGPIRLGETIRVIAFNDIFDGYGILVDVKKGRQTYQLPLADLEVKEKRSPQYQVVKDYAVWFANR